MGKRTSIWLLALLLLIVVLQHAVVTAVPLRNPPGKATKLSPPKETESEPRMPGSGASPAKDEEGRVIYKYVWRLLGRQLMEVDGELVEVDGVMIMKFISKLQRSNALQDAGLEHKADLFKKVLKLARRENRDLKKIFAASFEGNGREVEDFNLEFFVENAESIVEEEEEKAAREF